VASAAFVFALLAGAREARADFVTYTGSNAGGLSASASFTTLGSYLIVTLTNTASMDVMTPSQVLTGVWFSTPGALTPVLAFLNLGSDIINDQDGLFVGGEWAYQGNLSMSFGSNSGISAVGLGIFGPNDLFGGADLDPPVSPAGVNYGVTTANDNPNSGNGGILSTPLIQNSVVFVLGGWDSSWSLSDLSNVYFQYGSSLNEPRLNGVPEPGMLALLGVGLIALIFGVRKLSWA
jgi:hypothetical protein